MKKCFMFLFIVFTIISVSCSSSDNDNPEEGAITLSYNNLKSNIIGKWKMTDYYQSVITNAYQKLDWNEGVWYTYNFNSDGTASKINEYLSSKEIINYKSYLITMQYPYSYTYHDYSDFYPYKDGMVFT